jgi:hypothetical protein
MTTSLLRLRTRMRRAPLGTRVLAAALVLSLVFALTPCCEIFAAPTVPDAHAPGGHDHSGDAHHDTPPAGQGDPCATWLDRSDMVPPKAGVLSQAPERSAAPVLHAVLPPAAPPIIRQRPAYLPASPPGALYLLHARLLL